MPNITLNPDGNATFAGDVICGGDPNGGATDGSRLRNLGLIQASRASNELLWAGHTTGNSVATSEIKANGSATFAGFVASSKLISGIENGGSSDLAVGIYNCLLYTSPSPRDRTRSRMPSSA